MNLPPLRDHCRCWIVGGCGWRQYALTASPVPGHPCQHQHASAHPHPFPSSAFSASIVQAFPDRAHHLTKVCPAEHASQDFHVTNACETPRGEPLLRVWRHGLNGNLSIRRRCSSRRHPRSGKMTPYKVGRVGTNELLCYGLRDPAGPVQGSTWTARSASLCHLRYNVGGPKPFDADDIRFLCSRLPVPRFPPWYIFTHHFRVASAAACAD